jgi:hypothetical protein
LSQVGKPIHARSKSHDACGWIDQGTKLAPVAARAAAGKNGTIKAAEAWRQAVTALGKDKSAAELLSWIKANHPSVPINQKSIYTSRNAAIKSLAKTGAKNGRGRKVMTEAFPFGANAGDTQKQFQQILELTQQIPAEKIRKLLDLAEQLQKI